MGGDTEQAGRDPKRKPVAATAIRNGPPAPSWSRRFSCRDLFPVAHRVSKLPPCCALSKRAAGTLRSFDALDVQCSLVRRTTVRALAYRGQHAIRSRRGFREPLVTIRKLKRMRDTWATGSRSGADRRRIGHSSRVLARGLGIDAMSSRYRAAAGDARVWLRNLRSLARRRRDRRLPGRGPATLTCGREGELGEPRSDRFPAVDRAPWFPGATVRIATGSMQSFTGFSRSCFPPMSLEGERRGSSSDDHLGLRRRLHNGAGDFE